MNLLEHIRGRRLIQILGAYAAAGWVALEVGDQLVDRGVFPELIYQILLILYIAGFPAALILGWFHGRKGEQRITRLEMGLLSLVAIGALSASAFVVNRHVSAVEPDLAAIAEAGLNPNRLAVLYFDAQDQDSDLGHISEGLTESLIDQLVRVPGLEVVSRNGVLEYRGADLAPDGVARALNAGTLIQGSVRQSRDRLHVTLRLLDGASGAEFNRSSVQVPAGEFLAAQDSIAESMSRLLRSWLGEEVRVRQLRKGTDNVAAWALVQRAERLIKEATDRVQHHDAHQAIERYGRADSLLAEAEAVDTTWTEPIVLRGRVAFELFWLHDEPFEQDRLRETALRHAARALRLDPNQPDALELRGVMTYIRWLLGQEPDHVAAERLLDAAERDLREATRINPRQASAWSALSHLYYNRHDTQESNIAARRAYEADAYLATADQILDRLFTTSYDMEVPRQAVHWCEEGYRRFPNDPRFLECQIWNMTSRAREPDPAAAWELYARILEVTPEHDRDLTRLNLQAAIAAVLARAGLADSARAVLERTQATAEIDPTRDVTMKKAFARTLLGDREEAIELLGEYLTANPDRRHGFVEHGHWWWRGLREDSGFRQLVGLSE